MFRLVIAPFDGDVKILKPTTFADYRGAVTVTYLQKEFEALGLPKFVRSMRTFSRYDVLRGLHFQLNPPMGKLIQVVRGSIFLSVVDIRPTSPRFLQHFDQLVTESNGIQVWIPAGFALGYYSLTDSVVQYDTDAEFSPDADAVISWKDPVIGIPWPKKCPILSPRDMDAPTVKEYFEL